MSKFTKLMVITWNWNDPDNRDESQRITTEQSFDWWGVQGCDEHALMRIDPGHRLGQSSYKEDPPVSWATDSLPLIKEGIEKLVQKEQAKVQVYLHGTHKYKRDIHQKDLEDWAKKEGFRLECFIFRGADSCLYINENNEHGLLGARGRWADRVINGEHYQAFSGTHVNPRHFHFVWNFHEYKLDQELYALRESLIKILPLHWIPDAELSDFEWNLQDLRKKIDDLKMKRKTAEHVYQNWPEVLNHHKELMDNLLPPIRETLNTSLPSAADLKKVRDRLTDLLNALPGSHLYVKP